MESGIVFEIEKFATHDGPGIRTAVFLKGCLLRCKWCHSPESWSFDIQQYPNGEIIGRKMSADEVVAEALKDKDFYDCSGGGLTLSGGEPFARPEFAVDILRKAKAAGLHTAIETSGYAPQRVIEAALPHIDVWLWDVKELDEKKHRDYTLRPLAPILANLHRVNEVLAADSHPSRKVILRCPMIPGLNDDEAELTAIGKLADSLVSVAEVDVEPYIPYGIDKAHRLGIKVYEAPQPPPEYGPQIASRLSALTSKPVRLP